MIAGVAAVLRRLNAAGTILLRIDARLIPQDDEFVPSEILQVLTRRLGVLYGASVVTLWLCAWRFHGSAPAGLTIVVPLILSAVIVWRLSYWHRVRNRPVTTKVIMRSIARLQTIGPLVGLAFSLWGIALFRYGDPFQQEMIHYLTIVTALTATLCLCATPVASILLVVALMAPTTVAFLDVPNANSQAVSAIQVLLLAVSGFVAFAYQRDFVALIDARRLVLESERRLKAIAERESLLASIDPLTGLLNRRAILDYLGRSVDLGAVRLAMIDLDGFKDVNDSLGHAQGDYVLREIAQRLTDHCADCLVGRLGGDEFAIIYPAGQPISRDDLMRIVRLIATPMTHDNLVFGVGASLGYFEMIDGGMSLEDCLERADRAMYAAKAVPGPSVAVYGQNLDQQMRSRHRLISAISAPNFEQYLSLAYQPIVDVGRERVVGVEALARWSSPGLNELPATDFIAMAESCGQINAVTLAVVRRALRECRTHETGASLFVNVSARDLVVDDVMNGISDCVEQSGVPAGAIVFELTETAYINVEGAMSSMARMRARGFRFALDDFGSGQSSLSRVHRLPIDVIKVDGAFIEQVGSDRRCRAAVRTVIELASQLDVDCVIEGLETAEQVLHIQRLGGRLMQGYFFQRPGTAEQALNFSFGSLSRPGDWADPRQFDHG